MKTSAVVGDEWSAVSYPGLFIHRNRFDRRLGGPQSRFWRGGKEKNPCPYLELNLNLPARSLVTILTEVSRLRATHAAIVF